MKRLTVVLILGLLVAGRGEEVWAQPESESEFVPFDGGAGNASSQRYRQEVEKPEQDKAVEEPTQPKVTSDHVLLYYGLRPVFKVPEREIKSPDFWEVSVGGYQSETSRPGHRDQIKNISRSGQTCWGVYRPLTYDLEQSWFFDRGPDRVEIGLYAGIDWHKYRTTSHRGYRFDSRLGMEVFSLHLDPKEKGLVPQVSLTIRSGFTLHHEWNEARMAGSSYKLLYQNSIGYDGEVLLTFYRQDWKLTLLEFRTRLVDHIGETLNDSLTRAGIKRTPNKVSRIEAEITLRFVQLWDRKLTIDGFVGYLNTRLDQFRFNPDSGGRRRRVGEQVKTAFTGLIVRYRVWNEIFVKAVATFQNDASFDQERAEVWAGVEMLSN